MKEEDLKRVIEMARGLGVSKDDVDELSSKAEEEGVLEKAEELEREYAPRFSQFLSENGDISSMSNEEKARLIMEYKENLSKKEQKQFEKVLNMLKTYIHKER